MNKSLFLDELEAKELIGSGQHVSIEAYERDKPVSLFVFLRTMVYASISAFVGGLGLVIYQNIDTIEHSVLIGLLALATVACFGYVFGKGAAYRPGQVQQSASYFDIILLLGCLLFLALEGYAQYQYELFGTRYGLATVIPAVSFFFLAYRFDHQGVLSLALTALASWVGLTATPSALLVKNDFSDPAVIRSALIFGAIAVGVSWWLERRGVKPHFSYTYLLLAGTLYLTASLGGMFRMDAWQLAFAALLGMGCWYFFLQALKGESLLFLLISVVFAYTGLTYLLFDNIFEDAIYALAPFYFMASTVGVIYFFLRYKKILTKSKS